MVDAGFLTAKDAKVRSKMSWVDIHSGNWNFNFVKICVSWLYFTSWLRTEIDLSFQIISTHFVDSFCWNQPEIMIFLGRINPADAISQGSAKLWFRIWQILLYPVPMYASYSNWAKDSNFLFLIPSQNRKSTWAQRNTLSWRPLWHWSQPNPNSKNSRTISTSLMFHWQSDPPTSTVNCIIKQPQHRLWRHTMC